MGDGPRDARLAPARVLAGLFVPAALAVAFAVLTWAASAPISAVRAPGPAGVDVLVSCGAALLCAALLALAAVGAALSLAVVLTGQVAGRLARLADLLTPRVVRTCLGLVVGVTVVSAQVALSPALVASGATSAISASAGGPPLLAPGWSPDRPAATSPSEQASATDRSRTADRLAPVLVHRGDTLWAIAARHLGPGTTDAQVAAEWPRWHAANRSTIGADPDLIRPGQRLHAPARRSTTDHASHASQASHASHASRSRASTNSEESR